MLCTLWAARSYCLRCDPVALNFEFNVLWYCGTSPTRQVLIARGLFTEAEKQLTVVMDMVEGPNGGEGIARTPGRVQRVGIVLSVLANLYRQRCIKERMGIEKQLGEKVHEDGGGSFILAEGLYQRAFQMLGCPTHLSQVCETTIKGVTVPDRIHGMCVILCLCDFSFIWL